MKRLWIFLCVLTPLLGNYVNTPEDIKRLEFFNNLQQEKKQALCIPPAIHIIWLGSAHLSEESTANLRKWKELHPKARFCFWTDVEDRRAPLNGMELRHVSDFSFEFLEKPFSLADNLEERTALLAYEILYQEGGVYIDPSYAPSQSIAPLNESATFYCGLEKPGPSMLSTWVYPATHFIGSRAGHSALKESMQWLAAHWQEVEEQYPGTSPSVIKSRSLHRTQWALSEGIERSSDPVRVIADDAFLVHNKPSTPAGEEERLKELIESEKANSILIACLGVSGLLTALFAFRSWRKSLALSLLLFGTLNAGEFHELTGEKTAHWVHLTEAKDKELLEKCAALYEQKPLVQEEWLIPPVIHFIWLGPRPFPPESVENVRTWIAEHPDWKVKFWTDRLRDPPCHGMEQILVSDFPFQFLKAEYEDTQNWGEKSDILRFEILYREGGVYVDHDANCLQSFETLHHTYEFYAGLEAPHPAVMGRCLTVGNGVIGSRPSHPTLLSVLGLIGKRWEDINRKYRGNDGYTRTQRVMERTYIALTEALDEKLPEKGGVFPAAHFFAKGGIPSLYSKHFYANAWASEETKQSTDKKEKRLIAQLKRRSQLVNRIGWGAFGLNLLAFGALFFYYRRRTLWQ